MDLFEIVKVAASGIGILSVILASYKSWITVKTHTERTDKILQEEVIPAINIVKGTSETTLTLAKEALRRSVAAHTRIDDYEKEFRHDLSDLKTDFSRLDERTNILKQSGKFRLDRTESK